MSPKVRFNFFIDTVQREALRLVKERDGIPESEQIRRAIDEWLERRGASAKDRAARVRKHAKRP